MVFNATFILLVEKTTDLTCCKSLTNLSHNVWSTPRLERDSNSQGWW
jgi:hypothetical protein